MPLEPSATDNARCSFCRRSSPRIFAAAAPPLLLSAASSSRRGATHLKSPPPLHFASAGSPSSLFSRRRRGEPLSCSVRTVSGSDRSRGDASAINTERESSATAYPYCARRSGLGLDNRASERVPYVQLSWPSLLAGRPAPRLAPPLSPAFSPSQAIDRSIRLSPTEEEASRNLRASACGDSSALPAGCCSPHRLRDTSKNVGRARSPPESPAIKQHADTVAAHHHLPSSPLSVLKYSKAQLEWRDASHPSIHPPSPSRYQQQVGERPTDQRTDGLTGVSWWRLS